MTRRRRGVDVKVSLQVGSMATFVAVVLLRQVTQCTKQTVIYEHQDRFMVYSNDSGNKYPLNGL